MELPSLKDFGADEIILINLPAGFPIQHLLFQKVGTTDENGNPVFSWVKLNYTVVKPVFKVKE